jgi:hypothetical protein
MDDPVEVLKRMYASFNARDVEGVLRELAEDVAWANGMDGGHLKGHIAIRDYWTRQWAIVSPHVEPLSFRNFAADGILVEVRQSVRDLQGRPLQDQAHGLRDTMIGHRFQFENGKVTRFDLQEASS